MRHFVVAAAASAAVLALSALSSVLVTSELVPATSVQELVSSLQLSASLPELASEPAYVRWLEPQSAQEAAAEPSR